jgi:hypothetical protein
MRFYRWQKDETETQRHVAAFKAQTCLRTPK